jgi:hypothetical protein
MMVLYILIFKFLERLEDKSELNSGKHSQNLICS